MVEYWNDGKWVWDTVLNESTFHYSSVPIGLRARYNEFT